MKVLAVLLCALVAVQARSSGVSTESRALANLGDNPWLVHLRLAINTSGYLKTCIGSLITPSWVLSTGSCLHDATFAWVRYGTVNVIHPSFVTESNSFRVHPGYDGVAHDVGLVVITRTIESTDIIAPVSGLGSAVPSAGQLCGYGGEEVPGDYLSCFDVTLAEDNEVYVASSDDGAATKFDVGSPLVTDGVQVAILVGTSDDNAGVFIPLTDEIEWIEAETSATLRA